MSEISIPVQTFTKETGETSAGAGLCARPVHKNQPYSLHLSRISLSLLKKSGQVRYQFVQLPAPAVACGVDEGDGEAVEGVFSCISFSLRSTSTG
jgi:hypothetical protein